MLFLETEMHQLDWHRVSLKQYKLTSKNSCYIDGLNIWVKARTSQMWPLCLNAEIWEVCEMPVILRLNRNKQVLVEVVRVLKAENKVCLIFVAAKQQQKMYARPILRLKTNRSARDLF